MRVAIGADHAGFPLKQQLTSFLTSEGHTVFDLGTHSTASVDYPDYTVAVAHAVTEGRADRGIMICGSGVGGIDGRQQGQGSASVNRPRQLLCPAGSRA